MKFKEYIMAEGKDSFDKTVKKLAKMTDNNDHTSALAVGLALLGDKAKAQQAKNLSKKIDKAGGYSPGDPMDKEHKKLYKSMMDKAKADLSSSDYTKFYGSF